VSEWLVFQALFQAGISHSPAELSVFGAVALALVGGLALACFAKVCGVVFLGQARTETGREARELSAGYLAPAVALALGCVAIGFAPSLVMGPVLRAASFVAGVPEPAARELTAPIVAAARRISYVAGLAMGASLLLWLVRAAALRRAGSAIAATWGCGYAVPTPRMQYSASSFAAPLLGLFGRLSGVRTERTATAFHTRPGNLALERAFFPLWRTVQAASARLRPIQQGRLQLYLLYLVVTVGVLLVYLTLRGSP
jgi:hypothetical protein